MLLYFEKGEVLGTASSKYAVVASDRMCSSQVNICILETFLTGAVLHYWLLEKGQNIDKVLVALWGNYTVYDDAILYLLTRPTTPLTARLS